MAALTATPPKQDVAFSSFQQEEVSVEDISDITDNTKDIEEDRKGDEPEISRKISSNSVTDGGGVEVESSLWALRMAPSLWRRSHSASSIILCPLGRASLLPDTGLVSLTVRILDL